MNLFCQSLMIIINKNPNYSQTHIHSIKETLALFDARAATIKLIYMIILGPPASTDITFSYYDQGQARDNPPAYFHIKSIKSFVFFLDKFSFPWFASASSLVYVGSYHKTSIILYPLCSQCLSSKFSLMLHKIKLSTSFPSLH